MFSEGHENTVKTAPSRTVYHPDAVAVVRGWGMCYDYDYVTTDTGETATDDWGKRTRAVQRPDNTNNLHFAGVAMRAIGSAKETLEIAQPGSYCYVLTNEAVTIGDRLWCIAGSATAADVGKWTKTWVGFPGRGCAIALETRTDAGLVLAYLCDGPESGLVESITPVDATAVASMVGGVTHVVGGITLGTGDSTYSLPQGTYYGQRKAWKGLGTLTTNDYKVTLATTGVQQDDSTSLDTIEIDAASEVAVLEFLGDVWKCIHATGATLG